jgi:hypothetical protein
MSRKLLFLVFTSDACRQNHAFLYALDLERQGHRVRIILEGEGTRCIAQREGRFATLFDEALKLGILAGACQTASRGCSSGDESRNVVAAAEQAGLPLLGEMAGHASIEPFVREGYEIVVF